MRTRIRLALLALPLFAAGPAFGPTAAAFAQGAAAPPLFPSAGTGAGMQGSTDAPLEPLRRR